MLTLGAAAIHFAVAPDQLHEYLPFGIFFLASGAAQVALALAIIARPSRALFRWAVLATLGMLALWGVSRTTGLPIGPEPWKPEEVGFPDVITVALETVSVLFFAFLAGGPRLRRRPARKVWRVVRAAVGVLATLI